LDDIADFRPFPRCDGHPPLGNEKERPLDYCWQWRSNALFANPAAQGLSLDEVQRLLADVIRSFTRLECIMKKHSFLHQPRTANSLINSRPLDASLLMPDVSHSQIVFLKSVAHQYASRGVQVLLVDATALAGGEQPDQNALLNFARNWDMEAIPVLMNRGIIAQEYGISQAPTTLLIAPDGRVTHRWDGLASAAQLASAVQPLVGPPDSDA
jgi:hypothetical protein